MSSVFTKIRKGEVPGEILYQDDVCFAILTIQPHYAGHLLLIPIKEIADWQDIPSEDWIYLMKIAQQFGKLTKEIYNPPKVALTIVGFEVPHVHVHIFSIFTINDISPSRAETATAEELKKEANKIRNYIKNNPIEV